MSKIPEKYEAIIGLEVHSQLLTNSKIFCGCSTNFGAPPNTNICPICMGIPGVLPVLNANAVEFIIRMGLTVNCKINLITHFARKNYFYPDLPKGYQISQFEKPFCENGYIEISPFGSLRKRIRVKRIHLEEDAGKLLHEYGDTSLADLNRCGIPLMEIVSEPDMNSPSEAYMYLVKIKQLVKYLGICDGNMEEGSLRCDANVSVRLKGEKSLGTKTELKNMNSFRNVEKAIAYEIERQVDIIESGEAVIQETLLWDAELEESLAMRSKEEAHDYRYFPEPDLLKVKMTSTDLENIRKHIPELPDIKREKFIKQYSLPEYDAELLTSDREIAEYFEKVIRYTSDYKSASNWIMGDVMAYLKSAKSDILSFPVPPENLAELINAIGSGKINSKIAKEVFPEMMKEGKTASEIISEKNLQQVTDEGEISSIIDEILSTNPLEVKEYISGKDKVIGFFIGRIMKKTSGKANPGIVNRILRQKLESIKLSYIKE